MGSSPSLARRPRVALCTSVDWPELPPDDRSVPPALARAGVDAEIATWTDDRFPWERFDLIVVRSCWDYHHDLPRWLGWIDGLGRRGLGQRLCNPGAALHWNARKSYLSELAALGVATVPTRWLGLEHLTSPTSLIAALADSPWEDLVCKPAVSAGALGTIRLQRGDLALPSVRQALKDALPEWGRRAPLMVQPFLREIADDGEWSLLFFDGKPSHAVRKIPAPADFRVQESHGGQTVAAVPPPRLQDVAAHVLTAAAAAIGLSSSSGFLYARVDLIVSEGQPLLIELEITEPALFLGLAAPVPDHGSPAETFARAIVARASAMVHFEIRPVKA